MKSNVLMFSKGKNDECLTPDYAVKPILEYIKPDKIIWCPFDKEESEFVKQISKTNEVIFTHIDFGKDFLTDWQPKEWDVIISNPPFTNKRRIFERALSFNKPFALIMSNTWLNDAAPMQLFMEKELQLLMFDKRIKFVTPDKEENKGLITFSSSYYCYNFLPKQIVIKSLRNINNELHL